MTINLGDVTGFVFDFDGVFYPEKVITRDFNRLCNTIKAQVAFGLLKKRGMDRKTAIELAYSGYQKYGDSITGYCVWAKENGVNSEKFKHTLFVEYHKNLQVAFYRIAPHVFNQRRDLISAFKLSEGAVKNGVATHSCATHIARPFLRSMGIRNHFHEAAIIGLADGDYTLKHTTPHLIELACTAMEIAPETIGFVEDSPRNLNTFKEKYPNAPTIYIHSGSPLVPLPNYIDFQFYNILEMKRAWAEERRRKNSIVLPPSKIEF
ncbi:MAG: hypothetical protein JNL76_07595 [Alphaproteobacteria bacterium]|nr:hypothetical protein [Alphaproteobacteria bacterium]